MPSDEIRLLERRRRLTEEVNRFCAGASEVFLTHAADELTMSSIWESWDRNVEEEDEATPAEQVVLPFPSSLIDRRSALDINEVDGFAALSEKELQMRKGQANDALRQARITIAHKSFIYRDGQSDSSASSSRTRSHGVISSVNESLNTTSLIYAESRRRMILLGASAADLEVYQELHQEDLAASTAVVDPNRRGQRSEKLLSWIWGFRSGDNVDQDKYLMDCKCAVHQ